MTFLVPALLFLLLAVVFIWDDVYGFILLLGGFVFCDRSFAHLNVNLFGQPLYITEFVILVWYLRMVVMKKSEFVIHWKTTPIRIRKWWLGYLVFGAYSLCRGFFLYELPMVLRDSAICYYSFLALLVSTIDWTERRLHHLFTFLGVVAVLRAASIQVFNAITNINLPPAIEGQPAAISLILCITLLFCTSLQELRMNVARSIAAIILYSAVSLLLVRSAWTGLIAGWCLLIVAFSQFMDRRMLVRRIAVILISMTSGAYVLSQTTSAVIAKHREPRATPQAPIATVPVVSPITPMSTTVPRPPVISNPPVVPLPDENVVRPKLNKNFSSSFSHEFSSLFRGRKSDNANARLLLWRNAISEIFGVGLFSPLLRYEDLSRYNLPSIMPKLGDNVYSVSVYPLGFKQRFVPLRVETNPEAQLSWTHYLKATHGALFGIPFGKLFLPPEVVWVMDSPGRFDPHNSLLAVFYRMGFFGLTCFTALSWVILRPLWTFIPVATPRERLLSIAVLASAACFLVHSLTDNTLENPFKSIWYWSLLGFAWGRQRSRENLIRT